MKHEFGNVLFMLEVCDLHNNMNFRISSISLFYVKIAVWHNYFSYAMLHKIFRACHTKWTCKLIVLKFSAKCRLWLRFFRKKKINTLKKLDFFNLLFITSRTTKIGMFLILQLFWDGLRDQTSQLFVWQFRMVPNLMYRRLILLSPNKNNNFWM